MIMENTINVTWGVTESSGSENFTLEELEVSNRDEWDKLSQDEQREKLQHAIDELDRVFIIVDGWS